MRRLIRLQQSELFSVPAAEALSLARARRKHAELVERFPSQFRFVLETLREVYIIDARARKESLYPQQRPLLHQEERKPLMETLER